MDSFDTNINIQTLIGIFVIVFGLMLSLLGFLLARFTFLDGKQFFFSSTLGRVLMLVGGILAFAAVLMVIYVRIAF